MATFELEDTEYEYEVIDTRYVQRVFVRQTPVGYETVVDFGVDREVLVFAFPDFGPARKEADKWVAEMSS